ncbi:MAG: carbon monoxide dehydrogenase [Leptolyngbyaceae cyanobacterium CRU_2_3]|nr:carbon monoxide dehydrogenase [Leptolyngbyaceae cyanobacterium CRU_2_3]
MDLHTVETYLCPTQLESLPNWQPGWAWVAGGTWMFTEPQRDLTTLVDLQGLGWSELEVSPEGLEIGATCTMSRLLQFDYPAAWTAIQALQSAVQELASFKIQNMATIAGNLCLALPAGTFAPVMVLLDAQYEILQQAGNRVWVAASDFQTGARQTILQPGDVLRRIFIPQALLQWQVNYRRMCVATAGLAVAIAVAAYNPQTHQVRFAIAASLRAPRLLEFHSIPSLRELEETLSAQIPLTEFIEDDSASALYRRHITQVLMMRSLQQVIGE